MSAFTLSLWNRLASSNAFMGKVHEQIWNTETINGLLHKTCSKPVFCFRFFSAISSPIWPARHSIIGNVIVQLVYYFSFFLFSLILNANLKHLEMFSTWHFFSKYCIYSATIYSLVFIHEFGIFNRCLFRIGLFRQCYHTLYVRFRFILCQLLICKCSWTFLHF